MVIAADLQVITREEVEGMKTRLVNRVPRLLENKGWDIKTFTAYCMLSGMSSDTARRLVQGELSFTTGTLQQVAEILELDSIAEVIDIVPDEQ
jgi:hypothetical protein